MYRAAGVPVDLLWDDAELAAAFERLATFARVIVFDPRGNGASDAASDSASLTAEAGMADVLSVMDAAGSTRAALLATDNAAAPILLAVSHPDRLEGLVLLNAYARLSIGPDHSIGIPDHQVAEYREHADAGVITGVIDLWCAGCALDEDRQRWILRCMRASASPRGLAALFERDLDTDVRDLLPLVQVPTRVLHTRANRYLRFAHAELLAAKIPGAQLVALDGAAHLIAVVPLEPMVDAIEELMTGHPPTPRADRVFATVLFSDIVDSTGLATRLGDDRWRGLLDRHDAVVTRQLTRFGGRLIKSTGDGIMARFDGPARAVACAQAMRDGLDRLGVGVRVGIHAGEVELRGDDLAGIAVHIASRVQAHAREGEILVSRTMVDLMAGSTMGFDDRGEVDLKGVSGRWRLFAVRAALSGAVT